MRRTVRMFWVGVGVASAVFIFTGGTRFDLDATATDPHAVVIAGRVDQGSLGRLFSPASPLLGTVRVTKRGWGIFTTYTEQITIPAAPLATAAGAPLSVQVNLDIPGTVTGSNATSRDGRTLVWSAPTDGPLWAQSRAVNWLLATVLAAALALTFWMRWE